MHFVKQISNCEGYREANMSHHLHFILEGVLLPTVGTLGVLGNIASIAVLRSR